MISLKENYLTDKNGNRIGVVLELDDYHKLLSELEELESLRAYDAAKSAHDESIPYDVAIGEIEKNH
jgi:hypothetical protein